VAREAELRPLGPFHVVFKPKEAGEHRENEQSQKSKDFPSPADRQPWPEHHRTCNERCKHEHSGNDHCWHISLLDG
jgi:hypothetical protein